MKNWIVPLLCTLGSISFLFGQNVPFTFNYQMALKDEKGFLVSNKDIKIRFQILRGSVAGSEVFSEIQELRSSETGIIQAHIGSTNSGELAAIDFFADSYFLKVWVDGKEIGTSQLLSVPYAFVSQKAAQLSLKAQTGQVLKYDGTSWVPAQDNTGSGGISSLFGDATGNTDQVTVVGLRNRPVSAVSPVANQYLKWDGAQWVPAILPADTWGSQVVITDARTLKGNGTAAAPIQLADLGATPGDVIKWDGRNWIATKVEGKELVQLSIGGDVQGPINSSKVVSLQNLPVSAIRPQINQFLKWDGNSWIGSNLLSGNSDNWGSQVVVTDLSLSGDGTNSKPLGLSSMGASRQGQFLIWDGAKWVLGDNLSLGGDLSGTTLVAKTVALQGRAVSPSTPADGQVLKYIGSSWLPAPDRDAQTLSIVQDSLRISGGNAVPFSSSGLWVKSRSQNGIRNATNGPVGINMEPGIEEGLHIPKGNLIRVGDPLGNYSLINDENISLSSSVQSKNGIIEAKKASLTYNARSLEGGKLELYHPDDAFGKAGLLGLSATAGLGINLNSNGSKILEIKPELVSGKSSMAGRMNLLHANGSLLVRLGQRDTSETLGFVSVYNNSKERIRLSSSLNNNGGQFQLFGKNDSVALEINTIARASDVGSFPNMKFNGYNKSGIFLGYTQVGTQYFPIMSFGTPSLDAVNPGAPVRIFVSGTDQRGQIEVSGNILCNSGMKCFVMEHPEDPTSTITYACVEGPEAGAYERGSALLVNGRAEVLFSEHYAQVVNPATLTIQITPGSLESKGLAIIEKRADGFVVGELYGGKGNYGFDWEVKGVRKGFENFQVIKPKVASR